MKYARFVDEDRIVTGEVVGEDVYICEGDLSSGFVRTGEKRQLADVALETPVAPTKILCVGLNYVDHIKEFNRTIPDSPVVFIKPNTALLRPYGEIVYPEISKQVDYEGEFAVVIGKPAKNVSEEEAGACIFGYTCANDVTARDRQPKDGQWAMAKGCDTFCPIGPFVVTELDTSNLGIRTFLNDKMVQNSNTSFLLFKPEFLVSYISQYMTLLPGDVILTGTSSGVGPMVPGDRVVVEIEGIGRLENVVK